MPKKAQITLYIIVVLVLLFLVGLVLMSRNAVVNKPDQIGLEQSSLAAENIVNSCLEKSVLSAIDSYPMRDENRGLQEMFIEKEVKKCSDFSSLKNQQVMVEMGKPAAKVYLSDTSLVADLTYPVTVSQSGGKKELSGFQYSLKRDSDTRIIVGRETALQSSNKKAELKIPEGASVALEGKPVDWVSLKLLDRNYNNFGNTVVVGSTVYEGLPEGLVFSPYAEFSIKYNEYDIPIGVPEDSLTIAYYDDKNERWVGLESEVDKNRKIVTAKIKHFSGMAMSWGCKPSEQTSPQVIQMGWLYREPCYSGGREERGCTPAWIKGDDGSIYAPQGLNVNTDNRFLFSNKNGIQKARCYKKDWDNNPGTPDNYGYDSIEDVGGTGEFTITFPQDGNNVCIYEKNPIKITVNCDDECSVLFNGKELQESNEKGTYFAPIESILKTGHQNIVNVEVKNKAEHCAGANGKIEFTGLGLLSDCTNGLAVRNCKCGTNNINLVYDREILLDIMEKTAKKYEQLSDEELKGAITEENKVYCCSSQISKNACGDKPKVPEPQKQEGCTVQDRINYLCKYGKNSDDYYNPLFPKCSGVRDDGKPVGFSDTEISSELGFLAGQDRSRQLSEICNKEGGKEITKKPEEPEPEPPKEEPKPEQPPAKNKCENKDGEYCAEPGRTDKIDYCLNGEEKSIEEFRTAKGNADSCADKICISNSDLSFKECRSVIPNGKLITENNKQRVYLGTDESGNEIWKYCDEKTLGETARVNRGNKYDLLCIKSDEKTHYVACNSNGKNENLEDSSVKTTSAGKIIYTAKSDYICTEKEGEEKWQRCGTDIKDKEKILADGRDYYCCGNSLYTVPCNEIGAKKENLCLHTHFSTLSTEDYQLDFARNIGVTYVKPVFEWRGVQPNSKDEYYWDMFDRWFNKMRQRNLKVIARISGAPNWARTEKGVNSEVKENFCGGNKNRECISLRPDIDKLDLFADFVGKFVARYKPEYVQIWNEPNLAGEWSNKGVDDAPMEYGKMMMAVYPAVKKANPDTKVILGAIAPTTTSTFRSTDNVADRIDKDGTIALDEFDFIDKLYQYNKDIGNYYDVLGVNSHPFPDTAPKDKCGAGNRLLSRIHGQDISWMIQPLRGPGGNCLALDRVRQVYEYTGKYSQKPVTILELSYYIGKNYYDNDNRDYNDKNVIKQVEINQKEQLQEAYNFQIAEWKPWIGPICWFLVSNEGQFDLEGNLFRKKDLTLRPAACGYGEEVSKRPLDSLGVTCTTIT